MNFKKVVLLIFFIIFLTNLAFAGSSSGKAFLYSLILPGAGQYYNNSKTKGEIFIFSEVVGICSYYYLNYMDEWKVNNYKTYANSHFNYSDNDPEVKSYTEMWHILVERVYAKTNLPYEKEGEYWELIGKLEQLEMFWDKPSKQDYYMGLRDKANKLYKRKNMVLGFVIVNHVVSAVDALIEAKNIDLDVKSSYNYKNNEFSITFKKSFHGW